MKIGLLKYKVKPPNKEIIIPPKRGMYGIFFSSIICERDKEEEIFDARTSDAIALALRFDSPIYTYDKILDKAGIILKKEMKEKKEKKFDESFKGYNIKQLNKKISKAIEDEDYELAAKLRDEINQRK